MSVAFDAQSTDKAFFATVLTTFDYVNTDPGAITVGTGSNRAIVLGVVIAGPAGITVSSVTWDQGGTNQAATAITGAHSSFVGAGGSTLQTYLYGLVAPTSGQKTWRVVTSAAPTDVYLFAVSYTGVDQTGGVTSFAHGTNGSGAGAASLAVTSASGNATVAGWCGDQTGWTSSSGTNVFIDQGGSVSQGAGNRDVGPNPTMTMTPNGDWSGAAVDVVASGGAAGLPAGINYDYPNPRSAQGVITTRGHTDVMELVLLRQDKQFGAAGQFKSYDYPNPRGKEYPLSLRAHTDSYKLTLIGQDRFFDGAGRGPNYDWPNPRGPSRVIDLLTNAETGNNFMPQDRQFGAPGQTKSYDWPNPRGPSQPFLVTNVWIETGNIYYVPTPFFNTHWPNPPLSPVGAIDLRTWIDSGNALFTVVNPFSNYDWPNPRGYAQPLENKTWLQGFSINFPVATFQLRAPVITRYIQKILSIDLLTWVQSGLSLQTSANPFSNYDWPNPRGATPSVDLRTTIQTALPELFGQDKFFGAAGQGPTYDWPNPRGVYTRSLDLLTWTDIGNNFPPIITIFPFQNYDWPNPRGATHNFDLKTWLQGTFYPLQLIINPPSAYDWPNPQIATPNLALRTWTQGFGSNQLITNIPFFNYDWPNPPRGSVPGISLKTHADSYKLTLIGQDKFFGGAGQGPTYDYPNPRGATPGVSIKTHIDSYKLSLIGQDTFFGGAGQGPNYDWPNPRGPQRALDLLTWLGQSSFVPLTFTFPPPFNYDWPNPNRGAVPSITLRTHTDSYKLTLIGQDAFFGGAGQGPSYDWPNPRGPAIPLELKTIIVQGLSLKVFFAPFMNYDWPNPRGYAPTQWRTHTDSYKLTLIGQDRFFGAAGQGPTYDWPNPRGPARALDLITWLLAGNNFPPIVIQVPFMNYDWPNPRGYVPALDLKTWLETGNVLPPFLVPFNLYDWPVPRGPVPGISLKTHADSYKLTLIGQDRFFGGAGQGPDYDWPNPRGPLQGVIDNKSWLQGFGIGQLTFVSPNPPPTNYDWPIPKGKQPSSSLATWISTAALFGQPYYSITVTVAADTSVTAASSGTSSTDIRHLQ